ncbi:hypothetical protein WM015_05040 [Bifidobacterium mongoliense]|jgi:hypothetical protein|uniref:hypothetical protein n=1 Tax=Bifidobacterium mongoliense TaxID=518643 RepID=UPI0030F49D87
MGGYIPDDAAMSHEAEPWRREQIIRRRTMNRMQARKDRLIDLLASPLPDAERSHLTKELDDLRHDIGTLRYGATDYAWEQMRNKWRNR